MKRLSGREFDPGKSPSIQAGHVTGASDVEGVSRE